MHFNLIIQTNIHSVSPIFSSLHWIRLIIFNLSHRYPKKCLNPRKIFYKRKYSLYGNALSRCFPTGKNNLAVCMCVYVSFDFFLSCCSEKFLIKYYLHNTKIKANANRIKTKIFIDPVLIGLVNAGNSSGDNSGGRIVLAKQANGKMLRMKGREKKKSERSARPRAKRNEIKFIMTALN